MAEQNFYKTTIRLTKDTYNKLNNLAEKRDEPLANVIRETIERGLANEWVDENKDLIANIVREQIQIALKPSVERLAKIGSKSGHMSATAAFLNVQALMDLVPPEQRKDVRTMYESARKKAITYMKTKTDDWEYNESKNRED
jgi:predicted DNA-binding protein